MARAKPKLKKKEMKQVHFDIDLDDYLKFEKIVYKNGVKVSEFFREKVQKVIKKGNI
ncbi:hypothetical protein FDG04_11145 [Clostridium sporogenes]|uniref:hypothetical protein n=1 Tax=Clostridium sporogenes TaxID=1509 RepID=UPI0015EED46F|nr:hypothetical protein [Clostridium sporogenes]MBA4510047.1 hypothetical protein [Clostridium sporogenes]MDU6337506.1 hypothetical protein [Clostridium sporogenes]NFQ85846.1 hypothetical protein [Clostridium sporogenes]